MPRSFHNKSKSTSMPKLSTSEGSIRCEPEAANTTATAKTGATESTKTAEAATTSTTTSSASSNPNAEVKPQSEPSQQISESNKPRSSTPSSITRCPFCRGAITVTRLGPCCKLWTKSHTYKRRSNPTAEVPDPVRQQFRRAK